METLIIIAASAFTIVDVWFNSELFAEWRSYIENWHDYPETRPWLVRWTGGNFYVRVLSCRYCLSFYATLICSWLWRDHTGGQLVVFALAAQRVLWLVNGFLPRKLSLERFQPDPAGFVIPPTETENDDRPQPGDDSGDALHVVYVGTRVADTPANADGRDRRPAEELP